MAVLKPGRIRGFIITAMLYDKDIREPLFLFMEEYYGKARMIEEKIMGRSRADVVMVTEDSFFGIEIKSDADTYSRLGRQVPDYDLYFDYNYVAVGSTHAFHIAEHVPPHWGIITIDEVEDRPDFYIFRKPQENPGMDLLRKLSLLWRPELARILERNGLPPHSRFSKKRVIKYIADSVPYSLLRKQMSYELFERDYTTIADEINRFRTEQLHAKPRRARRPAAAAGKRVGGIPDLKVKKIIRHRKKR